MNCFGYESHSSSNKYQLQKQSANNGFSFWENDFNENNWLITFNNRLIPWKNPKSIYRWGFSRYKMFEFESPIRHKFFAFGHRFFNTRFLFGFKLLQKYDWLISNCWYPPAVLRIIGRWSNLLQNATKTNDVGFMTCLQTVSFHRLHPNPTNPSKKSDKLNIRIEKDINDFERQNFWSNE